MKKIRNETHPFLESLIILCEGMFMNLCVCVFNLHAKNETVSPLGTSQPYRRFVSVVPISAPPHRRHVVWRYFWSSQLGEVLPASSE